MLSPWERLSEYADQSRRKRVLEEKARALVHTPKTDGAKDAAAARIAVQDAKRCSSPSPSPEEHIAEMESLTHTQLRMFLKARGVQNSFLGSSREVLRDLARHILRGLPPPPQLMVAQALRASRTDEYEHLLAGCTLERLSKNLPDAAWEHYERSGWLKLKLRLSKKEKRMIRLCHRVALCGLGVSHPARVELTISRSPRCACALLAQPAGREGGRSFAQSRLTRARTPTRSTSSGTSRRTAGCATRRARWRSSI